MGSMTQQTVGGQDAEDDRPPAGAVLDRDATSTKMPSVGIGREERPWCLTWS